MTGSVPVTVSDFARLHQYVERFFLRSGKTEWPTVKRAARSLRWRQSYVEAIVTEGNDPDDRLFLSSYDGTPEPTLAEHFIEATGEFFNKKTRKWERTEVW